MTVDPLREELCRMAEAHLKRPLPAGELAETLDSVQRLSLVVAIEDHFGICFEPEDEQQVCTLDDLVALVRVKRPTPAGETP